MHRIHVEGLRKSFRDGDALHEVLRGVDLDIAGGEFVALIGRSGSGKSTLLHCLAGIETADAGRVEIDGVNLTAMEEGARTRLRRDRIGVVFQFFHLLPALTVRGNVELPAQLKGDPARAIRERSDALLDELGLLARAEQYPDRLSGGEQQRVAIARALINRPSLLLADEPTGNLDAETAGTILDLFAQVHQSHGVTILMVTHSDEAAATAQRSLTLVQGSIEPSAPTPTAGAAPDEAPEPDEASEAAATAPEGEGDSAAEPVATEGVRRSSRAAALFAKAESPDPQVVDAEAVDEAVDGALAESDDDAAPAPDDVPESETR